MIIVPSLNIQNINDEKSGCELLTKIISNSPFELHQKSQPGTTLDKRKMLELILQVSCKIKMISGGVNITKLDMDKVFWKNMVTDKVFSKDAGLTTAGRMQLTRKLGMDKKIKYFLIY